MIADYDIFIAHLKRTGRLKLLPQVLRELCSEEGRQRNLTSRRETAEHDPSLISGYRAIENGMLTDRTGKRALLEIYQTITSRH